MIETKVITPSVSEIYSGGGKWLTQSAPTNFHQFYRRRQLLAGESVADWREVTDAEKATLEAQDAAWVEPEQGFVDVWNSSGGWYNPTTGFFRLNGLNDITYAQARSIFVRGIICQSDLHSAFWASKCRTHLPFNIPGGPNLGSYTFRASSLEVAGHQYLNAGNACFHSCSNLKKAILCSISAVDAFLACPKLETIETPYKTTWTASISLKDSPLLTLSTVSNLVDRYQGNTSARTITVHKDVFAKLTGDTTNAAAAALTEEELAQWMALPEIAAARNVTFVSA